mmetsp:Transcript_37353/g.77503  ORF Transcript_37353/g.77503 Transcript_37353/m.77503 type:complete len:106 (+) Transcript_37353:1330-1647(+)
MRVEMATGTRKSKMIRTKVMGWFWPLLLVNQIGFDMFSPLSALVCDFLPALRKQKTTLVVSVPSVSIPSSNRLRDRDEERTIEKIGFELSHCPGPNLEEANSCKT